MVSLLLNKVIVMISHTVFIVEPPHLPEVKSIPTSVRVNDSIFIKYDIGFLRPRRSLSSVSVCGRDAWPFSEVWSDSSRRPCYSSVQF